MPALPVTRPRRRFTLTVATLLALAGVAVVCASDGSQDPVGFRGFHRSNPGQDAGAYSGEQPFPGVFSLGATRLHPGAVIDAWDSPIEEFLQGHSLDSGRAQVRSAGPIDLEFSLGSSPTVIVGHANPAQGAKVQIEKGGFVTGSIAPSEGFEFLPPLPEGQWADTEDFILTAGRQFTGDEALVLGRVLLDNDATWTLRGPLHLQVRELVVAGQASLAFDTTHGPVILQVTQGFHMGPETQLLGSPENLGRVLIAMGQGEVDLEQRLETGQDAEQERVQAMRDRLLGKTSKTPQTEALGIPLEWQCMGRFFGLLYAPFSRVQLPSGLRFQGSLTGGSIELEANAHVTCDGRALEVWQDFLTLDS